MSEKLLPCPWCNGEPFNTNPLNEDHTMTEIGCIQCAYRRKFTEPNPIAAWNTRAGSETLAKVREALEAWDEGEAVLIMHNAFAHLPEHATSRYLKAQQMRRDALALLEKEGRDESR